MLASRGLTSLLALSWPCYPVSSCCRGLFEDTQDSNSASLCDWDHLGRGELGTFRAEEVVVKVSRRQHQRGDQRVRFWDGTWIAPSQFHSDLFAILQHCRSVTVDHSRHHQDTFPVAFSLLLGRHGIPASAILCFSFEPTEDGRPISLGTVPGKLQSLPISDRHFSISSLSQLAGLSRPEGFSLRNNSLTISLVSVSAALLLLSSLKSVWMFR